MRLLVPGPGRANDGAEIGSAGLEAKLALGARGVGDQNGGIAGAALAHHQWNAFAGLLADRVDDLPDRIAGPRPEIEYAAGTSLQ